MAGIGPINNNRNDVFKKASRQTTLTSSANELEIFYNLCIGRVHNKSSASTLYYIDSFSISVSEIIHKVFNQKPDI
jgi:hypothetical protein